MRNVRFSEGFGTEIDDFLFIQVLTPCIRAEKGVRIHV
jgi:hypothetical protein